MRKTAPSVSRLTDATAVAAGYRWGQFTHLAVIGNTDEPISPCGACRQVLHEFSPDTRVILATTTGKRRETTLRTLLPDAFGPADLSGA